ncbi:MAG TPA: PAS domain S-box protein [Coleofasciculaceae cyanobacterium]
MSHPGTKQYHLRAHIRKEAKAALPCQDDINRIILDSTRAGLFLLDLHGVCIYANPAAEVMTGYRFDELRQVALHDMIHHEHTDGLLSHAIECPVSKVLQEGREIRSHDEILYRKDGTSFNASCSVLPIRREGVLTSVLLEVRDITDEIQARQIISESEYRFRAMADAAPVLIWMSATDAQCDYFNKPWLDFTGRTMAQELGIGWTEGVHPDDYEHCMATYLAAFKAREPFKMDYRLRRYDGQYRWILDHGIPRFSQEGEFMGYIGSCIDITERKEVERRLEEGLARESLNRRILEISGQPLDTETILSSLAEEVGRFFKADRCLLFLLKPMDENGSLLEAYLSGQYNASPDITPVRLDELPVAVKDILIRNLSPDQALMMRNLPTPEAYVADLAKRFQALPVPQEEREEYLRLTRKVIFEVYGIKSNLRVGISYRGKAYGTIMLQQCTSQRIWTPEEVEMLNTVGRHLGSVIYQRELYQQERKAARELQRSYDLINIIRQAQTHFITNEGMTSLFVEPVKRLLEHTGSGYGFIAELLRTGEGHPYLRCYYLSDINWRKDTRHLFEEKLKQGLEFHNLHNLCGEVINTGKMVISNNPDNDPRSSGPSGGQPRFQSFMGMPLYKGATLVGMIGIANCPEGYEPGLYEELQPFLDACANIIVGYRSEQQRRKLVRDLKVSERALKIYAARLERSNKELEQFATIASHDLQAPLRKVLMFSDFLQATASSRLSSEDRDYLDRIQVASHRMQKLISDLLLLSRVTRKGQPFRPVNLRSTLQEVLSDLEEPIQKSHARIEIGDMMTIEADPTQMQQVLQNLISNAIKFHKPDEPPVVRVGIQTLDNKICRIIVEDNGIGFDEKYQERIFEVFERLHTEKQYEGTGMGLAIVRKIAERHGGTVQARSHPGQGSIFTVTLPIYQS